MEEATRRIRIRDVALANEDDEATASVLPLESVSITSAKPLPPPSRASERLRTDKRFDQASLNEFKARARECLPPESFAQLSEEDFERFIVAQCGNVAKSVKLLCRTCAWLGPLMAPVPLSCSCCEGAPTAHSHVPIGIEGHERSSIIYGCPARASDHNVDRTVEHVARQLQYAFDHASTGPRWVWCVDYSGFGLKHAMQGELGARFATLFSNMMPERLVSPSGPCRAPTQVFCVQTGDCSNCLPPV